MSVCAQDKVAWIRVEGRANFNSSVDFKAVVNGLSGKGYNRFVLDLTQCALMDSTFLGVLSGLGLKFSKNGSPNGSIELLNPNERVADLLENLGVNHLFKVVNGPEVASNCLEPVEQTPASKDQKEVTRTCLEAHQTLMNINPNNVSKFKDVAQFLAEDLKKMQ
jgi:anti-anti-sigma factor